MKMFLFYMISLLFLASCTSDYNGDIEVKANDQLGTKNFVNELVTVSKRYGYNDQNGTIICYAPQEPATELKDKNTAYGWDEIALCDAVGALNGALDGLLAGGATLNPGLIIGFGVVEGACASLSEYFDQVNGNGGNGGGDKDDNGGDDGIDVVSDPIDKIYPSEFSSTIYEYRELDFCQNLRYYSPIN